MGFNPRDFAAFAMFSKDGFSTACFIATFRPFNRETALSKYRGYITYLFSSLETIDNHDGFI
jgi:hypothetical protein